MVGGIAPVSLSRDLEAVPADPLDLDDLKPRQVRREVEVCGPEWNNEIHLRHEGNLADRYVKAGVLGAGTRSIIDRRSGLAHVFLSVACASVPVDLTSKKTGRESLLHLQRYSSGHCQYPPISLGRLDRL